MEKEFYERLRLVLYNKRWTATQLSKETGIDISTISRWKVRGTTPRIDSMEKIAAATGCNINYLYAGQGEMFPQEKVTRTNIQVGEDQNYQESGAIYQRGADNSCSRCSHLSFDTIQLANLIQQCESPLQIRKLADEYQQQIEKYK